MTFEVIPGEFAVGNSNCARPHPAPMGDLFQDLAGKSHEFAGIPSAKVRIGKVGFTPETQRRSGVTAEATVSGMPKGLALLALSLFGEGAERAFVAPSWLGFGNMLDIVLAVMCRVFVQPGPHFFEFLHSIDPFHDLILPDEFGVGPDEMRPSWDTASTRLQSRRGSRRKRPQCLTFNIPHPSTKSRAKEKIKPFILL